MAYFLFIDESGQDHRQSPYEVLAGVAIEDRDVWNLIQALHDSELRHFGTRYSYGQRELKAKKLLKKKVFKHAREHEPFPEEERRELAKKCLVNGPASGFMELCALAQAKIAYVDEVLEICARFRCKVFASIIVDPSTEGLPESLLRKDYSYLFERFYYYLEDMDSSSSGIIVFDELEKAESHVLVGQMDRYFKRTAKGKARAGRIIPEPFFVHSELTTGVQLADLVAYLVSWGFRTRDLKEPVREELSGAVDRLCRLRHKSVREIGDIKEFSIWSFAVIPDLKGREAEQEPEPGT